MANKIVSISFLYQGERLVLKSGRRGTFRVPVTSVTRSKVRTEYKNLTAREVIEHKIIRNCDPVLTLNTGEKIRVYQGGDSSYLPAMSEGILEKHDAAEAAHRQRARRSHSGSWGSFYGDAAEQLALEWGDIFGDYS